MKRGVAFAAALVAMTCMGMGAAAEAITEAAGEELTFTTEAETEGITEAETEGIEAITEAETETETEEEIEDIPDQFYGEWQMLGMDGSDYAIDASFICVLPDRIIGNSGDMYAYALQDDGSAVVILDQAEEQPENITLESVAFEKRMLEEADLETFGLPEDAERLVGKAPVMAFTKTVNSTANPLADETIESTTLYVNKGYTNRFIDEMLTANEWTVSGNKLVFSLGEGEIEGTLSMNDGEKNGTFMVMDGVITMYWSDQSFDYSIQSVSEDPVTRGDIVLVETEDASRTLELTVIRPETAESETETNAQ